MTVRETWIAMRQHCLSISGLFPLGGRPWRAGESSYRKIFRNGAPAQFGEDRTLSFLTTLNKEPEFSSVTSRLTNSQARIVIHDTLFPVNPTDNEPKPKRASIGVDGTVPIGVRATAQQIHAIELYSVAEGDVQIRITEFWMSGNYAQCRRFNLTPLTHLLLNITDEEMASISNRTVDAFGNSTKY